MYFVNNIKRKVSINCIEILKWYFLFDKKRMSKWHSWWSRKCISWAIDGWFIKLINKLADNYLV